MRHFLNAREWLLVALLLTVLALSGYNQSATAQAPIRRVPIPTPQAAERLPAISYGAEVSCQAYLRQAKKDAVDAMFYADTSSNVSSHIKTQKALESLSRAVIALSEYHLCKEQATK